MGRMEVTHAADDDNIYFVSEPRQPDCIQIDTYPGGQPPFFIQSGGRHKTTDTAGAVDRLRPARAKDPSAQTNLEP